MGTKLFGRSVTKSISIMPIAEASITQPHKAELLFLGLSMWDSIAVARLTGGDR